jgi:hypothetical protein
MDRCTPECSHEGNHTRRRWRRSARPRRRAPPRDDASRLVWPPHSASTCPRPRVSTTYPNDDRHGWGEPRPVSYPIRAVNNPSSQRAHLYLDRSGPPPWLAFRTAAGADGTRGEVRRWEDARVASWRLVGWGGPPCLRLSVAGLMRSTVLCVAAYMYALHSAPSGAGRAAADGTASESRLVGDGSVLPDRHAAVELLRQRYHRAVRVRPRPTACARAGCCRT